MSFICSLISFKSRYSFHLKLFSVFIGFSLLTEILARFGLKFFHLESNYLIYNVYLLIEYIVYAFYFKSIMPFNRIKKIINLFILVISIIWVVTTFVVFKLTGWNSYLVVLGDLFIICMSVLYFYKAFISENLINFQTTPEFWIAAGSFIYACCELPITGILNHLVKNYATLTIDLYDILQLLNILMYTIFIYAFLCPLMINTAKS